MPAIGVASWDLRWTCELCKVLESVEHVVVVAVCFEVGVLVGQRTTYPCISHGGLFVHLAAYLTSALDPCANLQTAMAK
jgi:hypothetical protein